MDKIVYNYILEYLDDIFMVWLCIPVICSFFASEKIVSIAQNILAIVNKSTGNHENLKNWNTFCIEKNHREHYEVYKL